MGSAGSGKSVVIGELFDDLASSGVQPLLVPCQLLPSTRLESEGDVARALSTHFGSPGIPLIDIVADARAAFGACALLIDTLDVILSPQFSRHVRQLLEGLRNISIPIIMTCRTEEYDLHLHSMRVNPPVFPIELFRLPSLSDPEIRTVSLNYFAARGSPEAGPPFVERLLQLRFEGRSVRQIVEHPLLLGMLHDLYGPSGLIAKDLTPVRLFERFWDSKVAITRDANADSSHCVTKRQLCLDVASHILGHSSNRFVESFVEEDVPRLLQERDALRDLRSEGVLVSLRDGQLRFFHQTFAEHAVARLLLARSRAAERAKIVQTAALDPASHWWPVVRQFLAMIDSADFEEIVESMDATALHTFRAIAIAAATREAPAHLRRLANECIQSGVESFQLSILDGLESAPADTCSANIDITLQLIAGGTWRVALRAVETAAWQLVHAPQQGGIGSVIETVWKRHESTIKETKTRHELLLTTLASRLLKHSISPDPATTRAIASRYVQLGPSARSALLELAMSARLDPRDDVMFGELESLLSVARSRPPPRMGNEVLHVISQVLARELSDPQEWIALVSEAERSDWAQIFEPLVGLRLFDVEGLPEALVDAILAAKPPVLSRLFAILKHSIGDRSLVVERIRHHRRSATNSEMESRLATIEKCLSEARPSTGVGLAASLDGNAGGVIRELCQIATSHNVQKKDALGAAERLRQIAEDSVLDVQVLFDLFDSPVVGVRDIALEAIAKRQGPPLDEANVRNVMGAISSGANAASVHWGARAVGGWVWEKRGCPQDVFASAEAMCRSGSVGDGTGAVASGLLIAKCVAQVALTQFAKELRHLAQDILARVDVGRVRRGETHLLEILAAIGRSDSAFLLSMVPVVPPAMTRNVLALAYAIRRVEGFPSSTLDALLARVGQGHLLATKMARWRDAIS